MGAAGEGREVAAEAARLDALARYHKREAARHRRRAQEARARHARLVDECRRRGIAVETDAPERHPRHA